MTPPLERDEIILDTGPAIALDRLGYADLLSGEKDLLLSLPLPVAEELAAKPDHPGGRLPARLCVRSLDHLDIHPMQREIRGPILGPGEIGVIAAAEDQWSGGGKPACAVIDDRDAWEFARSRWGGVDRLTGSLSLLYLVHERRLEKRPLREDVDLLARSTHRLSGTEAVKFLRHAGPLLQRNRATGTILPAGEAWLRRVRESGMQRQPHRPMREDIHRGMNR